MKYDRSDLIKSVFGTWIEESNGQVSVRIFGLQKVDIKMLSYLGEDVFLSKVDYKRAYQFLFDAAQKGGVYSDGSSDNSSRLKTMLSLCGILGIDSKSSIEAIERIGSKKEWFYFSVGGYIKQLGLVCVLEKEVVVLFGYDDD
jgi:hypothetical protein